MDHLWFLCLVFPMLSLLLIAALWSPAGKGADLLAFVGDIYLFFGTFPCGILGQVWYLIVSFSDLCHLSYFVIILQLQCHLPLTNSFLQVARTTMKA